MRDLASPVVPVLDGILVMPLIGVIGSDRAALLIDTLLRSVERYRRFLWGCGWNWPKRL